MIGLAQTIRATGANHLFSSWVMRFLTLDATTLKLLVRANQSRAPTGFSTGFSISSSHPDWPRRIGKTNLLTAIYFTTSSKYPIKSATSCLANCFSNSSGISDLAVASIVSIWFRNTVSSALSARRKVMLDGALHGPGCRSRFGRSASSRGS